MEKKNKRLKSLLTIKIIVICFVFIHFIISLIMLISNSDNIIFHISKKNERLMKKGRYLIDNVTDVIQNTLEDTYSKFFSILQNNKFIWFLSLVICLVFCILIGISIFIDYKKIKQEEENTYYNKFEKKIKEELKELRKDVESGEWEKIISEDEGRIINNEELMNEYKENVIEFISYLLQNYNKFDKKINEGFEFDKKINEGFEFDKKINEELKELNKDIEIGEWEKIISEDEGRIINDKDLKNIIGLITYSIIISIVYKMAFEQIYDEYEPFFDYIMIEWVIPHMIEPMPLLAFVLVSYKIYYEDEYSKYNQLLLDTIFEIFYLLGMFYTIKEYFESEDYEQFELILLEKYYRLLIKFYELLLTFLENYEEVKQYLLKNYNEFEKKINEELKELRKKVESGEWEKIISEDERRIINNEEKR